VDVAERCGALVPARGIAAVVAGRRRHWRRRCCCCYCRCPLLMQHVVVVVAGGGELGCTMHMSRTRRSCCRGADAWCPCPARLGAVYIKKGREDGRAGTKPPGQAMAMADG